MDRRRDRKKSPAKAELFLLNAKILSNFQIFRGLFALVRNYVVLNGRALVQRAKPSALHRGDVNEYVLAAALRCDKSVSFRRVEPLHSTCCHKNLL